MNESILGSLNFNLSENSLDDISTGSLLGQFKNETGLSDSLRRSMSQMHTKTANTDSATSLAAL